MQETPAIQIRSSLRQLFLRSKERAEALKRDKYTCQKCGRKQSKRKGCECKVQVHHKDGVMNWGRLLEEIRRDLLCDPEHMETLCAECHKLEGQKHDKA